MDALEELTPSPTATRTEEEPLPALGCDFASLGQPFFTPWQATALPAPYFIAASPACAALLGWQDFDFDTPAFVDALAGNRPFPASQPLAAVYSGHQFGVWAGQLGDGRALLLGDVVGPQGRYEIQLKGAGQTPYSRFADGRAVLRSSIREFLCSEAMAALNIPTTRALALVGSDQPVIRETVETAAVVARVAPTFVRFGSFEHWFAANDRDRLRQLADYVIARWYPALRDRTERYAELVAEVSTRSARLVADWQSVGFCHGVLNTDNMSILGLTLDYGPYGFMEAFDVNTICNHSDQQGRYSYGNQPRIVHWNLFCLAQALLPLIGSADAAQDALSGFKAEYESAMQRRLQAKLGLESHLPADQALFDGLFALLQANHADFTIFFRQLARVTADPTSDSAITDHLLDRDAGKAWLATYRARLAQEGRGDEARAAAMNRVNPKYILRNYLAELAIRVAGERDFSVVRRLQAVLAKPFDDQPEAEEYARLPPDWAANLEVSCSS